MNTPKKAIPEKIFVGNKNDYYSVKVKCLNCGFSGKVLIQKRTPLYHTYCPNCECIHCLKLEELVWKPPKK